MKKPDFRELKNNIKIIESVNLGFESMFADRDNQKEAISSLCALIAHDYAIDELSSISVTELKNSKAGIRVSALLAAGYNTLGDIARVSDHELLRTEGIGEKQTESIRQIITEFANSLSSHYMVGLEAPGSGKETPKNNELLTQLWRYMKCEKIRSEAEEPFKNLRAYVELMRRDAMAKSSFRWLFSGNETKQHTLFMIKDIEGYCASPFFKRLLNLLSDYNSALKTEQSEALDAYSKNSADFYALLENLESRMGHKPFLYDSIPVNLADAIEDTELCLEDFKGNLRAYQAFGAKYILNQKKVLLGDEMGLGKTIQAIAVMIHINATEYEKSHFLIVCPASVIINWEREIRKFSELNRYILHGQSTEGDLLRWKENGGAAITNYESLNKIIDGIDNRMKLSLLIIDEAHYIKNPGALRTQYIRKLYDESESILLMTGTPLENRVDEMCNLIEFIRPDMTQEIRKIAHLRNLPEFKEKLSSLYLRRTRKQVLTELPPIDEKQEWCDMTLEDRESYVSAVASGSFSDMRRVSYIQDDTGTSSKAARLLEICQEAVCEGRKVVVFSFFRDTIEKISCLLGDRCAGVITGDTRIEDRQLIIDRFGGNDSGDVLICQVQAGGVGLNIQAASIVIFCEPQIKPSLTWQALSRVYRMGQIRNVLVYHLLCQDTLDEYMIGILEEKKLEFNDFADGSAIAEAYDSLIDKDFVRSVIEQEKKKYLPMVVED